YATNKLRRAAIAAAFVLSATSCAGDVTAPPPAPSGSIALSSSAADVFAGDVITLRATVRSADGSEISNPAITWTSLDSAIALVGANGEVTALREGSARIKAQ